MIYEEEIKEGYEARMDKKSLLRIIHKLALDKLVQHLQITLQANNREKVLRFICDPSVSHGMKNLSAVFFPTPYYCFYLSD